MTEHLKKKSPLTATACFSSCLLGGLLLAANMAMAQEHAPKPNPRNGAAASKSAEKEAYEKLLQKAGQLIKDGKAAEAHALLEGLEFEHAGEERFDYLLGIAALDSGQADKATFAFERILALNPASLAARMEMGRAYFQLGDMPRAKTEFEAVLKLDPPAAGRSISQKYLDEIAQHDGGRQTCTSAYIEATLGQDGNVNNSTSQSQVFVDAIAANTTLDPVNIKTADQFAAAAAGARVTHKPNPQLEFFAGTDMRKRNYSVQKNFDTLGVDAHAGMAINIKTERLQLAVLGGQYHLGLVHYSDSRGIKGEWRHVFSPSNQLQISSQQIQYKFVDVTMQPNDYMQQVNSIGWLHVLADGKTSLFGNAYFGGEQDTSTLITSSTPNGGRTDGAKNLQGLRIGAQTAITDHTSLYASAGMLNGNFSRINPFFLRKRSDRQLDCVAGTQWRMDKLWTLRTQLNYAKNESNIAIYEYDRLEIAVSVRRDFR